MPIYEFECPSGHVTSRPFKLSDKLPGWTKCQQHTSTTHYPGCAKTHTCGKRAKRRQVYRVGVGGDLPTRGAF